MSPLEQEARRVAEWVLQPCNGPGLPGKGEKLWLSIVGGRVVAWQAAREPHSPAWIGVTWRAEYDAAQGGGVASAARCALANAITGAVRQAIERDRAALEAEAEAATT